MKLSGKIKVFGLSLLLLLFHYPVHAENIGLSIDQTIFTFDLDPGASQDFSINIASLAKDEMQMSVDVEDFSVDDQNKISILEGRNELFGMKDWIASKGEIDWFAAPSQEKKADFIIEVPKDATVGSHFAVVSVRSLPKIDAENFQRPVVSGRIGVYIMINVKGDVVASGKLNKFEAPLIADKQVDLRTEFENTGNVFYIPHGEVKISSLVLGNETKIETEKHFVFPGKKYSFDLKWDVPSIFGIYTAQAYFVDGDKRIHTQSKILMGKLFFLVPLGIVLALFLVRKFFLKYKKVKIEK
jgi:hypothetical protein